MNLTDHPVVWTSIFIEQMKYMDDSHLLGNLDKIKIVAITQNDQRNVMLQQLCSSYDASFEINFIKNPFDNDAEMIYSRDSDKSISETITLKKIWDDSIENDSNILYLHTKGMTSYYNHLGPDVILKHKQYYYWRQLMNWGVLERWRECVEALKTHDTAGCNYIAEPSGHFCGNFWWTKSSHVRRLSDPTNTDWWETLKQKDVEAAKLPLRFRDEMWICSYSNTKHYDIVSIDSNVKTFESCLPKYKYEDALK
jgi:hypothetical protein